MSTERKHIHMTELMKLCEQFDVEATAKQQFLTTVEHIIDTFEEEILALQQSVNSLEQRLQKEEAKEQEIQETLDDHRFMQKLSRTIRLSANPREIVEQLTQLVQRVVLTEESAVFLLNEEQTALVPLLPETQDTHFGQVMDNLLTEGIIDWVMSGQRVTVIPDIELMSNTVSASGERNYIIVPLILLGQGIGVYVLYTPKSRDTFSPQDLELLLVVAEQAAFAIENIRMQDALQTVKNELAQLKTQMN